MKVKRKDKTDLMLTPERESNTKINWYPGHMLKATRQLIERIKKVDIIWELRDARAPLMTANFELNRIIGEKSKLIVVNKCDLIPTDKLQKWKIWFENNEVSTIFISSTQRENLDLLISSSYNLLNTKFKLSRPDQERPQKIRAMIVGIPNCGKSTLINSLIDRKVARAANKPGHTTAQQWINLNSETQLLDTPGIMPPRVNSENHGKILSALHAIPDKIIGRDEVCLFIVRYLMSNHKLELTSFYKIDDNLNYDLDILEAIGRARGAIAKGNSIDYDRVYQLIINDFRSGAICKVCFNTPDK